MISLPAYSSGVFCLFVLICISKEIPVCHLEDVLFQYVKHAKVKFLSFVSVSFSNLVRYSLTLTSDEKQFYRTLPLPL